MKSKDKSPQTSLVLTYVSTLNKRRARKIAGMLIFALADLAAIRAFSFVFCPLLSSLLRLES